jgi:hypothetical protein
MPWNFGVAGHVDTSTEEAVKKAPKIEAKVRAVVEKASAELVAELEKIEGSGLSHARWQGEHDEVGDLHQAGAPGGEGPKTAAKRISQAARPK